MLKQYSTVLIRDVLSLTPAGGSLSAVQFGCPAELRKTPHSTALPPLRETGILQLLLQQAIHCS